MTMNIESCEPLKSVILTPQSVIESLNNKNNKFLNI